MKNFTALLPTIYKQTGKTSENIYDKHATEYK